MAEEFVKFDAEIGKLRFKETGQIVSDSMFKNIGHGAASIAQSARRSIRIGRRASEPGKPPRTRRQRRLKQAIQYAGDKSQKTYVVGVKKSMFGVVGGVHEHGETYKGVKYPARPFMRPALEMNLHRIGGAFTGSIGG